jgi:exosortase/archaeosortase family protein
MKRFVSRFCLVALLLFGVYCFPYADVGISESVFTWYIDGYARAVAFVLRLFESHITLIDNQIHGRVSLEVAKSCDAIECLILFAAAVVATPGVWSRRLAVLLVGLPGLAALNVARIVALYYTGVFWPFSFHAFHTVIWPLLLVTATGLAFLWAGRWLQPPERAGTGLGP